MQRLQTYRSQALHAAVTKGNVPVRFISALLSIVVFETAWRLHFALGVESTSEVFTRVYPESNVFLHTLDLWLTWKQTNCYNLLYIIPLFTF